MIAAIDDAGESEPRFARRYADEIKRSKPEDFRVDRSLAQGIIRCWDLCYSRLAIARNCDVGAAIIAGTEIKGSDTLKEANEVAQRIMRRGQRVTRLKPGQHGVVGFFKSANDPFPVHSLTGFVGNLCVQVDDSNGPMSLVGLEQSVGYHQSFARYHWDASEVHLYVMG